MSSVSVIFPLNKELVYRKSVEAYRTACDLRVIVSNKKLSKKQKEKQIKLCFKRKINFGNIGSVYVLSNIRVRRLLRRYWKFFNFEKRYRCIIKQSLSNKEKDRLLHLGFSRYLDSFKYVSRFIDKKEETDNEKRRNAKSNYLSFLEVEEPKRHSYLDSKAAHRDERLLEEEKKFAALGLSNSFNRVVRPRLAFYGEKEKERRINVMYQHIALFLRKLERNEVSREKDKVGSGLILTQMIHTIRKRRRIKELEELSKPEKEKLIRQLKETEFPEFKKKEEPFIELEHKQEKAECLFELKKKKRLLRMSRYLRTADGRNDLFCRVKATHRISYLINVLSRSRSMVSFFFSAFSNVKQNRIGFFSVCNNKTNTGGEGSKRLFFFPNPSFGHFFSVLDEEIISTDINRNFLNNTGFRFLANKYVSLSGETRSFQKWISGYLKEKPVYEKNHYFFFYSYSYLE